MPYLYNQPLLGRDSWKKSQDDPRTRLSAQSTIIKEVIDITDDEFDNYSVTTLVINYKLQQQQELQKGNVTP